MLLVGLVGTRLELDLLLVHPAHRRSGRGRALVSALLDRYPAVAGWSADPQVCEALGFRRTGRLRDGEVELAS